MSNQSIAMVLSRSGFPSTPAQAAATDAVSAAEHPHDEPQQSLGARAEAGLKWMPVMFNPVRRGLRVGDT